MLEILTDITPIDLLASPNVEVKDNATLSIGVVHEMSRIFYFLGVKLEAIDKVVSTFIVYISCISLLVTLKFYYYSVERRINGHSKKF
jgi:hypothetical protein